SAMSAAKSEAQATSGDSPAPVVICGAGIIGCSVAYYLAKRGVRSILLERVSVASAASGKAGGFLALDWCSGALNSLARESFRLHEELASELGADVIDYRRLDTLSVVFGNSSQSHSGASDLPDWVTGRVTECGLLGSQSSTAQVHPGKLTAALARKTAELVGSEVRIATVTGLQWSSEPDPATGQFRVSHVLVSGGQPPIACSTVVLAMGPWTDAGLAWLSQPTGQVRGYRAHSLVVQPAEPVSPHALFTQMDAGRASPEFYPRPDGTVYVCGLGDDPPLPDSSDLVKPDEKRSDRLWRLAAACSDRLGRGRLLARQACYLPLAERGLPLIGRAPGKHNAFVAAGHSCWGILNGPATGRMLADLILDGRCGFIDHRPFAF
ncbi:hypothetical protein BOX15_Mlig003772g1, partial [Macrostomum lignano]